jgi:hypothetical protein
MSGTGDIYEVQIGISKDGNVGGFKIEHRFASMPELETVAALRDEAYDWYNHLFPDEEPTNCLVYVMRLSNREAARALDGAVA